MNPAASTSYRCLSCQFAQLNVTAARRQLHTTSARRARKPLYPNVSASKMGLVPKAVTTSSRVSTKPYTDKELDALSKKYTEEQMAIIEMGEAAIPAEDLASQGLQRSDPNRIAYFDDFSTRRPIIDHPAAGTEDGAEELKDLPNVKFGVDKGPGQNNVDEVDPALRRLMQQTGLTELQIKGLRTKTLVRHRVVNQTRMGKISSQYYLTIAGNGNGMLGIGEGKSAEDADASRSALYAAIRNMKPIPRYEYRTIYGNPTAKVCASIVQLSARPPGFGNRCQSLIFEMARAAGIHDIAARTPRSRNKMNTVKAAYKALLSQRTPEEIAKARGRKMIDVRKVYYAGSVP